MPHRLIRESIKKKKIETIANRKEKRKINLTNKESNTQIMSTNSRIFKLKNIILAVIVIQFSYRDFIHIN